MGYADAALVASLGHAAFRMVQILRAPNAIADSQHLKNTLGAAPWPRFVPDWLYRVSWRMRRVDTDFHLLHLLQRLTGHLHPSKQWNLTKTQQWSLTGTGVVLAGAPLTPLSNYLDDTLVELLHSRPLLAAGVMLAHFTLSVVLVRFLFVKVLTAKRFFKQHAFPKK
jgi:hypothetical protein